MKITLNDDPPIWRRIVVPEWYSFANLHTTIQSAMGWSLQHQYEFKVVVKNTNRMESISILEDDSLNDDNSFDARKKSLNDIFSEENREANYIYDFGDYWQHSIEVENLYSEVGYSKLPHLIDGAGNCPPEDIGGIDLYFEVLRGINSNTGNEEDKGLIDSWRPKVKPIDFDVGDIYFQPVLSTNLLIIPEECEAWLRKLLQGKFTVESLIRDLSLVIPEDDIKKLYDCVLSMPLRYRNRALCVLAVFKEIPRSIISIHMFVSYATINSCIKSYEKHGVDAIVSDRKNLVLKHENPEYVDKLFSILHSPPRSHGFIRTSWRIEDLKSAMELAGMPIAKTGISKIIKNAGYSYRKAKITLTSNDPDYNEKLAEITKILSGLKENEKFFSIDEYGPFAIKTQGGKSLVPAGTCKSVPQWQKNKGSLILTAALELSTNQVTHFYSEKKNTEEMIKLLEILLEEYSNEKTIYFSWDAASWHASKELYRKVDKINSPEHRKSHKCPNIVLAPLPTCAQFLNVIESVFSGMARAIIHNSNYQSVDECKEAINKYYQERNERFLKKPKKAGNKIWGKERVKPLFSESNNCKDPKYR
jgi:transposase